MKTISPHIPLALSLSLAVLVASPHVALAQTFYSFAGGLNVARTVPSQHGDAFQGSTTPGFAAQASVGRRVAQRLSWRVDVFASQFELTQSSPGSGPPIPCPSAATCVSRRTSSGLVGVTGLAAIGLVRVLPSVSGLGMYLIAGAEADYLYQHPSSQGALRLGGSGGAGLELPVRGRFQAFVEARYHALIDAPSQPTWFAPVTFGIRF